VRRAPPILCTVPSTPEPDENTGLVRNLRVDVTGHPGTQVRVEVHHPDAPIVALFEAGLGLPLEVWHPVVELLPGVCAILADRPGLGGSTAWEHPPVLADHVALISDVLAACSPDPGLPVALVGHSYAGMLVKAFAQLHPEKVSALVLVDPSLAALEAGTTTLVERFPDVARDLANRLSGIGRWLGWAFASGGTVGLGAGGTAARSIADAYEDPEHQQASMDELLRIGDEASELLALTEDHPLPDVPILIIGAARWPGPVPLRRRRWLDALDQHADELGPGAWVVDIDGAHLLMLDDPEALARTIADALVPPTPPV
jgi:pimeloyl-ACP methyl ester carboxylesterase